MHPERGRPEGRTREAVEAASAVPKTPSGIRLRRPSQGPIEGPSTPQGSEA